MRREIIQPLLLMVGVLALGTVTFHFLEDWNFVDSFYFTGVTILTIGYGDLHPTTPLSKVLTVIFSTFTIGIFFYAARMIGKNERTILSDRIHHMPKEVKKQVDKSLDQNKLQKKQTYRQTTLKRKPTSQNKNSTSKKRAK